MKNASYLILVVMFLVTGCNPFGSRQAQTKSAIAVADQKAKQINRRYEPDLREIKPYQVYNYKEELADPFRVRKFLIQEEEKKKQANIPEQKRCIPPVCVPPEPHTPQLLEKYNLNALVFVGVLEGQEDMALIRTPDFGVVTAKVGDYLGMNNGKILTIKETALIIQEKIRKNGLWKDKKTVLMITR